MSTVAFLLIVFCLLAVFVWHSAKSSQSKLGKTEPAIAPPVTTAKVDASVPQVVRLAEQRQLEIKAFDAFMSGRAAELRANWLHASIAGVTHRNADGSRRQPYVRALNPYESLELRPEPENKFSMTAVAIFDFSDNQLGYVPEFLCADVFRAIQAGGVVEAYVAHVGESVEGTWGAGIGILWAKPRTAEEIIIENAIGPKFQGWSPAQLTGITKGNRQQNIRALGNGERLDLSQSEDGKILLTATGGAEIATLSKQQSARFRDRIAAGWNHAGVVLQIDEGRKAKPRIAIAWLDRTEGT